MIRTNVMLTPHQHITLKQMVQGVDEITTDAANA